MLFDSVRWARPDRATGADPGRFDRIAALLTAVGNILTAEGVYPILCPHVGTRARPPTRRGTSYDLSVE